jgi:hypothetical protein
VLHAISESASCFRPSHIGRRHRRPTCMPPARQLPACHRRVTPTRFGMAFTRVRGPFRNLFIAMRHRLIPFGPVSRHHSPTKVVLMGVGLRIRSAFDHEAKRSALRNMVHLISPWSFNPSSNGLSASRGSTLRPPYGSHRHVFSTRTQVKRPIVFTQGRQGLRHRHGRVPWTVRLIRSLLRIRGNLGPVCFLRKFPHVLSHSQPFLLTNC